jgi:hypothetical protein
MKKAYFSPEFEVVEIRVNMQLLATSSGEANGNGEGEVPPAGGL